MTEHDTPSTARTEAEYVPSDHVVREGHAFFVQARIAGATFTQGLTEFDRWLDVHDAQTRAEWVLAQVREELRTLRAPGTRVGDEIHNEAITDALAVVDRLEGDIK